MEENRNFNASIDHLVKKRKLQEELWEMPLPKKVQSNAIDESMAESTSSNSVNFNADDDDDETSTGPDYSSPGYSDFHTSSAATSSHTSSTEQESMSINDHEHEKAADDHECLDLGFENLLYSNTVAPSCNNTYVLSSGRWPVNQDSEQGSKKPTIDREFEQYFSKLML